jgi:transglutaminase-like putative cysteine protease
MSISSRSSLCWPPKPVVRGATQPLVHAVEALTSSRNDDEAAVRERGARKLAAVREQGERAVGIAAETLLDARQSEASRIEDLDRARYVEGLADRFERLPGIDFCRARVRQLAADLAAAVTNRAARAAALEEADKLLSTIASSNGDRAPAARTPAHIACKEDGGVTTAGVWKKP